MAKLKEQKRGEIILYKAKQGPQVEVRLLNETIWLSQKDMAGLFFISSANDGLYLKNIFKEGELKEKSVTEDYSVTASDGKQYKVKHYNLDAVISVGYRVNSVRGTQFRIWATRVLRDHITNGFTINEKRLLEANEKFAELHQTVTFLTEKSKK